MVISNQDRFRLEIMRKITSIRSFEKYWPGYKRLIDQHLGDNPTAQDVFDLGSELSYIFKNAGVARKEGQSALSSGGAAWEVLGVWYLNFVFWGTKVIATKSNKEFVPKTIQDSISITIANHTTNTESDVLVYSIPATLGEPSLEAVNILVNRHIRDVDLAVIQFKTNWNDNSQVPMLWDIIYNSYNSSEKKLQHVQVGINGVSPENYRSFSYSFMTVPTVAKLPEANNVRVARVRYLSGGNYWGRESESNVAQSFKEFFQKNFNDHFGGGVVSHIADNLQNDSLFVDRFRNLDFD